MSKHIAIKDFRDMLVELNSRVWLKRDTVIAILKGMADLPRIDIVYCEECKYREKCEQIVVFDIWKDQVEGRKIDFCSYGERIEE